MRWLPLAYVAVLAFGGCKSSGDSGAGGHGGTLASCPSNTPDDLISDFAQDNSLHAADGRQGGWYVYGDTAGMFDPPGGFKLDSLQGNPNCSGPGSLHIKGTGFAMWGAATGADFKPRPAGVDGGYGSKATYDASKYRGVAFWAKASGPLDGVQVSFPDLYTDGAAAPHDMPDPANPASPLCTACQCIYTAGSDYNCSPYLVQFGLKGDAGVDLLFSSYSNYQVDMNWKRFEVLFADTRQDPGNHGYHTAADTLDVSELTAMAIQINANYSTTPVSARDFDLWIDDVSFIK